MGENKFASNTVAVYGVILLICGISYTILHKQVEKKAHNLESLQKAFVNLTKKGIISVIGYSSAIPLAFVSPLISGAIYFGVSILWLIPDAAIEKALNEKVTE